MRTLLFLTIIAITFGCVNGQSLTFKYEKKDNLGIISNANYAFVFGPYEKKVPGILKHRTVNANGHRYQIDLIKTKDGKVERITDSIGTVVGTIFPDKNYNLVLPNGDEYEYKYISPIYKLSYRQNDHDVMYAETSYGSGQLVLHNLLAHSEVVQIAFLERCTYVAKSRQYDGLTTTSFLLRILTFMR